MNLVESADVEFILNKYTFDINVSTHKDLICTICSKLLRTGYKGYCGCKYCFSCIKSYLSNGENSCPGKTEACPKDLNISDLFFDEKSNKQIGLLRVKCPEINCSFRNILKNMETHIESHQQDWEMVGAGSLCPRSIFETVKIHLNDENFQFAQLFSESIDIKLNEIDVLKKGIKKRQMRIGNLENTLHTKNMEIETLKKEVKNLQNELSLNDKNKESGSFDKESHKLEKKLKDIEREQKRSSKLIERLGLAVFDLDSTCSIESTLKVQHNEQVVAPFKWRIENYIRKRNKAMKGKFSIFESEPFYSHLNGYKMRLIVYPNGKSVTENTFLSVYICIIKGEFDDSLSWPMKRCIKVALIDQKSGNAYKSISHSLDSICKKRRCVFYKPSERLKSDEDFYFGSHEFINSNVLVNNARLCRKGSILLRCTVD